MALDRTELRRAMSETGVLVAGAVAGGTAAALAISEHWLVTGSAAVLGGVLAAYVLRRFAPR